VEHVGGISHKVVNDLLANTDSDQKVENVFTTTVRIASMSHKRVATTFWCSNGGSNKCIRPSKSRLQFLLSVDLEINVCAPEDNKSSLPSLSMLLCMATRGNALDMPDAIHSL